jgi:hypothetical protein
MASGQNTKMAQRHRNPPEDLCPTPGRRVLPARDASERPRTVPIANPAPEGRALADAISGRVRGLRRQLAEGRLAAVGKDDQPGGPLIRFDAVSR